MKASARLLAVAAGVVLALGCAPGAIAANQAHRRHIQVFPPRNSGLMTASERDGHVISVSFEEPDTAILQVAEYDNETETFAATNYGAHFEGSLPFGHIRASFGTVGSLSVRFRHDGGGRPGAESKKCTGRRGDVEYGHYVGTISLRGEGGYFNVRAHRLAGSLSRRFRLRCPVKRRHRIYPPESLRDAVIPQPPPFGGSGPSLASLQVALEEGSRALDLWVEHFAGKREGATLEVVEREYQGTMPVSRAAFVKGTGQRVFLTSRPGESPKTATVRPPAPFSGEAEYVASSPTSHSWTGTLAVHFPGLVQPLTGPEFVSSLCLARPLKSRFGCEFVDPDFQGAEE